MSDEEMRLKKKKEAIYGGTWKDLLYVVDFSNVFPVFLFLLCP